MKMKKEIIEVAKKMVNLQKGFLLVFAFGIFSSMSFASANTNYQVSKLTISMWQKSAEFVVVMDGYQQHGQGTVVLERIQPGKHHIEVIQLHRSRCSNVRGKTIVHKGMIDIPRNSKMTAVIKPRTGMSIVNIEPLEKTYYQNIHGGNHYHQEWNHCSDAWNEQQYYNTNDECNACDVASTNLYPSMSSCGTIEPNYPNCEENFNAHVNEQEVTNDLYTQYMIEQNMYNDNSSSMPSGYYGSVMNEHELNYLMNELENAWFDSDRINLAKQRIKLKKVTSAQVLEIIQQFSFESSRLEVAKFAFDYTVDQENYYEVNAGFQFSSSINELNQAIGY